MKTHSTSEKKNPLFLKLARLAARIADDKKANDIVIFNVQRLTTVSDYIVLATVGSSPQMNAILDTIRDEFRNTTGYLPLHVDGRNSPSWAVLDYGGLVVHVMTPHAREFFALDRLWSDAKKIK